MTKSFRKTKAPSAYPKDNTETTFVNHLSDFIKGAEDRIFKNVDLELFRKNVTANLTASDKFLSVPADYLASFSLQITTSGSEDILLQKDVNFLQEAFPPSASTGVPRFYAIFDVNNFILAPTPNSNYAIELHYYYKPTSITAATDGTSWLGTNAPFALLYGSLVEAYTYMKGEPDIMQQYEKRFNDQLVRLKDLGEARENEDAYKAGLPRAQRT